MERSWDTSKDWNTSAIVVAVDPMEGSWLVYYVFWYLSSKYNDLMSNDNKMGL